MNVDQRLRSAADALRVEVATHLETGQLARTGNPRPQRRYRFAVVGLAAVVVVLLSVVVVTVRDDWAARQPAAVSADGRFPSTDSHVRLGWLPKGFVLQMAFDGPSSSESGGRCAYQQDYIRYNAARDRAKAVLTVCTGNTDGDVRRAALLLAEDVGYPVSNVPGPDEAIRVRDRDAIHIGPAIAWQESPDTIVGVTGPGDLDELVAFANGLQPRTDGRGFDPVSLPSGFEPLPGHPGEIRTAYDSSVWYGAPQPYGTDFVSPGLLLEVSRDTSLPLTAGLANTGARLVDINGAKGLLTTGQPKVTWDPRPGLRVELRVGNSSITPSQLLRAARSALSMTDREWRRYGNPHGVQFPNSTTTTGG